jgi:hypothetical protein
METRGELQEQMTDNYLMQVGDHMVQFRRDVLDVIDWRSRERLGRIRENLDPLQAASKKAAAAKRKGDFLRDKATQRRKR